jgi:hypothetical protein
VKVAREPGDRAPGRIVNCGTILGALGFLVFAFFGWLLVQFLCTGTGAPGSGWMDFPG